MNRLAIGLANTAALAAGLQAQAPLLVEHGEVVPDGAGQLVAMADFDGDGDLDVVAAPTFSSVSGWVLLRNDGAGGFTIAPAPQWPGLQAGVMPAAGEVAYSMTIPVNGGGYSWAWQAMVGNPLLLTNGAVTPFAL